LCPVREPPKRRGGRFAHLGVGVVAQYAHQLAQQQLALVFVQAFYGGQPHLSIAVLKRDQKHLAKVQLYVILGHGHQIADDAPATFSGKLRPCFPQYRPILTAQVRQERQR
jgi:hypothetical protein